MANLKEIRAGLKRFRGNRVRVEQLSKEIKRNQPELIAMLREVGVDNETGIVYDPDDESKGTAYVQQNKGTDVWDEEKILDWLSHSSRKSLKRKTESRVFDLNKWESLVASGEIPPRVAKKFQTTTEPPSPFIRFGKKKDNSL